MYVLVPWEWNDSAIRNKKQERGDKSLISETFFFLSFELTVLLFSTLLLII